MLLGAPLLSDAAPDKAELSVWVNEAIVTTYTYSYKTYDQDQQHMAHYFSTQGWISYFQALNASKLPAAVKENYYTVSAVAISPPAIHAVDAHHWTAVLPILVVYQNASYQQKQYLDVLIKFSTTAAGEGVRGLNIDLLQTHIKKPSCQCPIEEPPSFAPITVNSNDATTKSMPAK